jgi:hypothetical protein
MDTIILTDKQKERALNNFKYRKNYYSNYQKVHKEECRARQKIYFDKIYEDEDKHTALKKKANLYYHNVAKPRMKQMKADQAKLLEVLEEQNTTLQIMNE